MNAQRCRASDRQPCRPTPSTRDAIGATAGTAPTGYGRIMSHGLHRRRRDHLSHVDAAARHGYDPHRTARITEEAGAEEAYHPNGALAWRRILRRRTTDVAPHASTQGRTDSGGLGLIGSAIMSQVFGGILLGGLLIGHEWLGPGRGGTIGYLVGSALLTLLIWRGGKSS